MVKKLQYKQSNMKIRSKSKFCPLCSTKSSLNSLICLNCKTDLSLPIKHALSKVSLQSVRLLVHKQLITNVFLVGILSVLTVTISKIPNTSWMLGLCLLFPTFMFIRYSFWNFIDLDLPFTPTMIVSSILQLKWNYGISLLVFSICEVIRNLIGLILLFR